MIAGHEEAPRPVGRGTVSLAVGSGITLLFLGLLAWDTAILASRWGEVSGAFGCDFTLYLEATRRWMGGGPFYADFQLAGPYQPWGLPSILYPPPTLLLFIPFTVLPAVLWWVIPIGIIVAVVAWHRPRPLVWPVLAMCLWFPTTAEVIYAGNPVLWVIAALALGTRWPAASVLVALKPTLGPFALWGIRHRSWWIGVAILGLVSLPFAGMWIDYARASLNARDPNGILYSLNQVPTVLIPIVAWLGRKRSDEPMDEGRVAGVSLRRREGRAVAPLVRRQRRA